MLQQPANEHSYHIGREITFKSCPTLVALDECFSFASCDSLPLKSITVIDDLPYTRKKDRTTPEYRKTIRGHGKTSIRSVVHVAREGGYAFTYSIAHCSMYTNGEAFDAATTEKNLTLSKNVFSCCGPASLKNSNML